MSEKDKIKEDKLSKKEIIANLTKEVEDLKDKLASEKRSYTYCNDAKKDLEKEISAIHTLMDGMSNCPREVENTDGYYSGCVKLTPSQRLMTYFQFLLHHQLGINNGENK